MLQEVEIKHLMIAAIQASIMAGEAILEVYNSDDFQVNLKSDKTPLTLADRQAHEVIKKHLSKTHIPNLSEEGRNLMYDERKSWDLFWLVDPLDGTKEFIKQNGEFTVNIALVENNYPIMGVIYSPIFETLYFGHAKNGSFKLSEVKCNEPFMLSFEELIAHSEKLPRIKNKERFTITASRSHFTPETEKFVEEKKAEHPDLEIISKGSSLKMCLIAEGVADVYPRLAQTSEWDTAAGQAIIEGAGMKVISAHTGERLHYNKEELNNPWFICTK
jgi:3'(2'), 5'-bisphosphate nucleotidase